MAYWAQAVPLPGQVLAAPYGLVPAPVLNPAYAAPANPPNVQAYHQIPLVPASNPPNRVYPQWWVPNGGNPALRWAALPYANGGTENRPYSLHHVLDPAHQSRGHRKQSPDVTIHYDIREYPQYASLNTRPRRMALGDEYLRADATYPPCASMKIISKKFPWEIDVEYPKSSAAVTIGDVLQAVHEALHVSATQLEWQDLTEDFRRRVGEQARQNCDATLKLNLRKARFTDEGVKRVDWLVDRHIMKGLKKDERFIRECVKDPSMRERTWVLVTSSNDS
ncbi:uncharacterized protein EI90DRAFT_3126070 [Cantharellus anzutake]|uniref:uncharacterized protein n=1 Tax=Cantharellus anzutake TaxID=1750568 RepID=UPI0019038B7F|nr:uncharacterized protein EI90DRAFT_3126070 [Cantharellus anzutake]KAF8328613.1 hypothetical protein EI90DRAFT_3126070 [Cantharellus anzutake]